MSEPESLSQDEGLETHIRRHSYDRLLMISDGIFAIAITLAALEIKLPEHVGASLVEIVSAMRRPVAAYFISFLIVSVFWIQHRDLFARVRRVDAVLTGLTLLLLCLISLLPTMIHGLLAFGENGAGYLLYAMAMVASGVVTLAMWAYATLRPDIMRPEVSRAQRIARLAFAAVIPVIFTPMLFLAEDQLVWVLIPLAALALVVRRFILPRWLNAKR